MTVTLKLYGTPGTASVVSNLANVIVPRSGHIIAASCQVMTLDAAGDTPVRMQVSLLSVEQFTVNDAQGLILEAWAYWNYASAVGAALTNLDRTISGIRIPVVAGQKIYIHVDAQSSSDAFVSTIYLDI